MAYRGFKVVAFIPSGRKRVQSVLMDNLSRFQDIVDEVQIWLNTDDDQVEDLAWLNQLPDNYGKWVKLVHRPAGVERLSPKQMNTGYFYANTTDKETIYVRFDDDIVFVDDSFFHNLLDFRIDNPEYFLVLANIWNNAVLSYIHQSLDNIPSEPYKVEEPYCMDPVGWRNGKFAEMIHRILLEKASNNTTSDLFFDRADLTNTDRFSISCFCFFGKDFKEFNGTLGKGRLGDIRFDEEVFLTEVYPMSEDRMNTICGSALVGHYSFFAQRPYLDTTDVLESYRRLAKSKLSESYYDLLDNKIRTTSKNTDLVRVELPKTSYSSYVDAVRAEKKGFTVEIVSPKKAQISFKDKVVKTIVSTDLLTERNIDDSLALLYRSTMP